MKKVIRISYQWLYKVKRRHIWSTLIAFAFSASFGYFPATLWCSEANKALAELYIYQVLTL